MGLKNQVVFVDTFVMDKSFLKVMRRSSFLFISLSFLIIGGLGVYSLFKIQEEGQHNREAARQLYKIREELHKGQLLISRLKIQNKRYLPSKEFRRQWNELLPQYNNRVEKLFDNESQGVFGSLNISSLLYSNKWHLDEILNHDLKLKKTLLQSIGKTNSREFSLLLKEVESYTSRTIDQLKPFGQEVDKNIEYLRGVHSIILGIVSFLFLSLLVTVYFTIYRPWRESYSELSNEKLVLQDVLRESEIRGNTFSWELNYDTKVVQRSEQLHGIYQIDDESEIFLIYDEVSLLRQDFQAPFNASIDACALKGELLDIQVCLQAKNNKVYWFHYYGKRVQEGKSTYIKGTVRDISTQKLAEERFQKIFDIYESPCLIFGEGQIKAMNESALHFLGVENLDEIDKLHPAILFPLYQMDGKSSLDKLKVTLDEVRKGKDSSEEWTFQTRGGRDLVGRATIIHLPYTESENFLMMINDDSQKVEFERRLVDANRRALQARRMKLEYVTQVGIVLQDLTNVLKEEINRPNKEEYGHRERLEKISAEVDELWNENLSQSMDETSNITLTNIEELSFSLINRYEEMAHDQKCKFEFNKPTFHERFFWLDSAKFRLAMMGIVEGAMAASQGHEITCFLESDFKGGRHGKLRFSVKTNNPNWPGEDWRKLTIAHRKDRDDYYKKPLSLGNFFNIIEILQGEVFFERLGDENIVGFEFYAERAIGLTSEDIKKSYQRNSDNLSQYNISASDIWSHFGGDWDVIENTIKDFLEYYPSALADLLYYLRAKDSEMLVNTATDLYGVLSHFPFFTSIERIIRIQKFSRFLKFDYVEEEIEALSYDMSGFARALQEFLPEEKRLAS